MLEKHKACKKTESCKHCLIIAVWLVFVCMICLAGCSSPAEPDDQRTRTDLIDTFYAGKQLMDTGIIDLSTNWRHFYLQKGWSRVLREEGWQSPVVAAAAKRATLYFNVNEPSDRWFSFRYALSGLFGTVQQQNIEVFCNGQKVDVFALAGNEPGEARVFIEGKTLKEGVNTLQFRFTGILQNPDFDYDKRDEIRHSIPAVAAYFSDMMFSPGGRKGVSKNQFIPEQEAIKVSVNNHVVRQMHNTSISHAFEFQLSSVLHLEGLAQPPAGAGKYLDLVLSFRKMGTKEWQVLHSNRYTHDPQTRQIPISLDLELKDLWNSIAELKISVNSPSISSRAQIVWKKMEISQPERVTGHNEREVGGEQPDDIKHVVIILLDAARADAFGCYGASFGSTPRIDEFAKESLVFENAVAPAPYTLPSIASLFSGLLPETHGVRGNDFFYSENLPSLARGFKSHGFRTLALYGNGYASREFGVIDGCDEAVWLRGDKSTSEMLTDRIQENLRKLAESGERSFIYIHLMPPHEPRTPPAYFEKKFITADYPEDLSDAKLNYLLDFFVPGVKSRIEEEIFLHYLNNLYYADYLTGFIIDQLQELELYEDSLIILSSDHGEAFAEHGWIGHNTDTHRGMVDIPLIVHGPGIQPGRIPQQVGLIDVFPTLQEYLGLSFTEEPLEGRSLAGFLNGKEPEPGDYYYSRAAGTSPSFSLTNGTYKYVYSNYTGWLYDLRNDPGETTDISGSKPVLASWLRQKGLIQALYTVPKVESERTKDLSDETMEELKNLGYIN